jgi:hypothetical protein
MKLKKDNTPEWMGKIDIAGMGQILSWRDGHERPPGEIHCFIIANLLTDPAPDPNRDALLRLGVTINSHVAGSDILTGNIPYANLQQVCELPFIQRIEFPKRLYTNGPH